jgi:hypothetical protein
MLYAPHIVRRPIVEPANTPHIVRHRFDRRRDDGRRRNRFPPRKRSNNPCVPFRIWRSLGTSSELSTCIASDPSCSVPVRRRVIVVGCSAVKAKRYPDVHRRELSCVHQPPQPGLFPEARSTFQILNIIPLYVATIAPDPFSCTRKQHWWSKPTVPLYLASPVDATPRTRTLPRDGD